MVQIIREAGWEGFMALWEKFQEAVASSAHTQIFIYTRTNINLHTHTNISSALTRIFPEMSENIVFFNSIRYSKRLDKNKIWGIYHKSFGITTKNDANNIKKDQQKYSLDLRNKRKTNTLGAQKIVLNKSSKANRNG